MTQNRWLALLLIALFLLLGFYQEKVKISTNFILDHSAQLQNWDEISPDDRETALTSLKSAQNRSYDYYFSHQTSSWLTRFKQSQLSKLKWLITGASVLMHFLAVWAILSLWFRNSISFISLAVIYAAVIALAAAVFVLGRWLGAPSQSYAFSRELLGGLQSLVPLMLLAPAIWLKSRRETAELD